MTATTTSQPRRWWLRLIGYLAVILVVAAILAAPEEMGRLPHEVVSRVFTFFDVLLGGWPR